MIVVVIVVMMVMVMWGICHYNHIVSLCSCGHKPDSQKATNKKLFHMVVFVAAIEVGRHPPKYAPIAIS